MTPCPCCAIVVEDSDITPDGCYIYGSISLVSWRCKCGTNRAARFQDVSPELRRAAMLVELSRDAKSEMTLDSGKRT